PPGISGELCIAGDGVARGYLNRPELTAAKFITAKAAGARVYRTGDHCRFLADGNIEFLGRLDRQFKIRGFRVEPAEIESALERQHGISSAVAVPGRAKSGFLEVWAYVVPEGASAPEPHTLLAGLATQLPHYMLPSSIQVLKEWPLTPHKKID